MTEPRIAQLSDARELADALGLDAAELVERRRLGREPRAVKIGREWYYLREHVLTWLDRVRLQAG